MVKLGLISHIVLDYLLLTLSMSFFNETSMSMSLFSIKFLGSLTLLWKQDVN